MTKMSRVLAAAVLVGATGIAAAPAHAFFGWFTPWNWTGGGYPYGWGGYPYGWGGYPGYGWGGYPGYGWGGYPYSWGGYPYAWGGYPYYTAPVVVAPAASSTSSDKK